MTCLVFELTSISASMELNVKMWILVWRPVKKPTAIQTTKRVLWQEFQKLCDGMRQHCRLEGSSPSTGRRIKYMENYQPTMAGILAACLMADELPVAWEFAAAADDEKKQLGSSVRLMVFSRASCPASSPFSRSSH